MAENQTPLGKNQRGVITALRERGPWFPGCGWTWGTPGETTRILDSLVERGLVARFEITTPNGWGYYQYALVPETLEGYLASRLDGIGIGISEKQIATIAMLVREYHQKNGSL